MRGYTTTARFVSISLALLLTLVAFRTEHAFAQGGTVEIQKVTHYAGNTDVYTNRKNTCIKVKRKSTGETWTGTTDDLGRLVINTGTVVSKEDLEATEVKCPDSTPQGPTSIVVPGVVVVAIQTKQGQVKINLPDDIRPGDTISGTVYEYDARGNVVRTVNEAQSSDSLEGAVFDIAGQQHKLRDRILTFVVPTTAAASALPMILRDSSGREIGRTQIPVNQNISSSVPNRSSVNTPAGPTQPMNPRAPSNDNFQLPRIGQIGRPLTIPGNFDGSAGNTRVSIGDRPAELLAESPRGAFVRVPRDVAAGPNILTVEESRNVSPGSAPMTVRTQSKFNPVAVELSADKLQLMRGEGTTVHIVIRGLELDDYEKLLMLELENLSSNNVHFPSKEVQLRRAPKADAQLETQSEVLRKTFSSSDAQKGILRFNESLTGIQAGAFTINATLYASPFSCDDECKLSDPNVKNVEVKLDFVKFNEGQSQPIYDVKARVCCDICLKRTCVFYWTQNKWENHCTDWKTLFMVMKTDAKNWENMTNPGTNYKDEAAIKADATGRAATINCPIVK